MQWKEFGADEALTLTGMSDHKSVENLRYKEIISE